EVLEWLDQNGLEYLVNFPTNSRLVRLAEHHLEAVRERLKRSEGSERDFAEFHYRAGSWERERRNVLKAQVTGIEAGEPRDNPRFVVTNCGDTPEEIYACYTGRGDVENRIKELLHDLRFDLTSCTSFRANQFREILTVAAFVLYQRLRYHARRTPFAR